MNDLLGSVANAYRLFQPWRRFEVAQPSVNLLILRSRNPEPLVEFYQALGFTFYQTQFGDSLIAYCTVISASTSFQIHTVEKKAPTSSLCFGIVVPSVDDAVAAGVVHGGSVLTAPASWSMIGRRAALADPDGNRVELAETELGRPTGDYPE